MPRSLQSGADDGRLDLLRRNVRKYGAIFNPAARSTLQKGKIMRHSMSVDYFSLTKQIRAPTARLARRSGR